MTRRERYWTRERFIEHSVELHEGYYDYSLVEDFEKITDKVSIICPIHGEFKQKVSHHKKGSGCVHCRYKKTKTNKKDPRDDIDIDISTREGLLEYVKIWKLDENPRSMKAKKHRHFVARLKEETIFIGDGYGVSVYLSVLKSGHKEIPKCANPECSNKTSISREKKRNGFSKFCSNLCAVHDPDRRRIMSEIWTSEKIKEREEKSKKHYQELARSLGYENPESYIHPSYFDHIIEKRKETMRENWEGGHFMRDPSGKQKFIKSLQKNHGEHVTNPLHIPEVLEKVCRTDEEEWRIVTPEFQQKAHETKIRNWGGHPMKDENFKEEMRNRNRKKFGKDYPNQQHISDESIAILNNRESLLTLVNEKFLSEIAEDLGVHPSSVQRACSNMGVDVPKRQTSKAEYEIMEVLDEMGIDYVHGSRPISPSFEVDILIPSLKIGIEFNGMYWHCEDRRDCFYHNNKVSIHRNVGIRIMMVWEDEWLNNKDHMKNWIKMELDKENRTAYRIDEISKEDAFAFMSKVGKEKDADIFIGGYDGSFDLVGVIGMDRNGDGWRISSYISSVMMLEKTIKMIEGSLEAKVSMDNLSNEWESVGFVAEKNGRYNEYWMKRGQWIRYKNPIGNENEVKIFDAGEITYKLDR